MTIDRSLRDAYLARLGVEAEPPSAEALFRLHRAQVERVPYETLWIHMGERWSVDPSASVARVATRQRGGYCFHLNGAFSELLRSLGYDVVRHVGGVHGPDGATEQEMTNHLVLTVHGLPTDSNPDGSWYVDAGLGDALHEPLPLVAGEYDEGPFHLVLRETPGGVGDWHLTHDPKGAFTGMAWRSAPTEIDAFAERNVWLSTSEESGFVKVLSAQRRDATGVDILRGLTKIRIGDRASTSTLTSEAELFDVIGGVFDLPVGSIEPDARAALWAKVHAAHVAWEAAGRP
ncbi:MAG: arylamine N-acetyltransferase family protein [Acidimicrobiia bacterium]